MLSGKIAFFTIILFVEFPRTLYVGLGDVVLVVAPVGLFFVTLGRPRLFNPYLRSADRAIPHQLVTVHVGEGVP
jgi:hypothetical protein